MRLLNLFISFSRQDMLVYIDIQSEIYMQQE